MIATVASCGHYAIFSIDGEVLNRACSCAEMHLPGTPAAIVAGDLSISARKPIPCPRPGCGGFLSRPGAPHAPRNVGGKRVDCAGKEIAP